MKVEVRVDDARVAANLRAARRNIDRGVREGLKAGVERHGLPRARILAPGERIRKALTAGATTRKAYLQVSLRKAPEAGLLEFGGTVRTIIRPKHAQALMTPFGPRAAIRKPRHYRGRHYLERAVEATLDDVTREAQETIARVFGQYLEVE